MPSPPFPDPTQIETRLLVVAEMLDKAVAEVRRTMSEIKVGISDMEGRMTDIEGGIAEQREASAAAASAAADEPPGSTNV
jgi:signal transduction histidine kinase